jgi:hypothetical protein
VSDFVLHNPLLDEFVGVVGGGIVDNHYFEVLVVEVDHRLQVVLIPEVLSVVEGWNDNAEGDFRQVEVVLLGQSIGLLPQIVVALILDMDVGMGQFEVVERLHEGYLGLIVAAQKVSAEN